MKAAVTNWERAVNCLRIVPVSGSTLYFAQYPYDLTMGNGQVYESDFGYQFSGMEAGTNFSPPSMDLSSFLGAAGITLADIESGIFDNAKVFAFATDWALPVEDEEPIMKAIFGKTKLVNEKYTIEVMGLIDALNQSVGNSFTPNCPKTFGGQETAGCGIALGPITVVGTLTGVTDSLTFQDTGRAEAADYFLGGTIQFTSGDNVGLGTQEIKAYAANGTIVLFEPFINAPAVGDAYSLIPGCRKRQADCIVWNNIENFGGYSFIPTNNQAYSRGTK